MHFHINNMGKKEIKKQNEEEEQCDMEKLLNGLEQLVQEYKISKQKVSCCDREGDDKKKTTASRWYRIDNNNDITNQEKKHSKSETLSKWYKISNNTTTTISDEEKNYKQTFYKAMPTKCSEKKINKKDNNDNLLSKWKRIAVTSESESESESESDSRENKKSSLFSSDSDEIEKTQKTFENNKNATTTIWKRIELASSSSTSSSNDNNSD